MLSSHWCPTRPSSATYAPCVVFGWWFSPWELWRYWLVHIVVPPRGLQTPSAPWVLSLAPSLGTLCSVQWMAVSIHLCICQALAEPLRRQLYQAPVSKLLLASTIVSEFDNCIWDGSPVSGWSFLQSLLWIWNLTITFVLSLPLSLKFYTYTHIQISICVIFFLTIWI
jgi:hypothetical protein